MMRMIPAVIFVSVATLLFVALIMQPAQKAAGDFSGARTGEVIPKLPLKDAASMDAPLNAEQMRGKVTVINFLASWCGPCALEMKELVALKEDTGVHFIGVAWNDAPIVIDPWLKKHGNPFDTLRYDPGGRGAIALGLRGIPETFVIDHRGVVRYQIAGALAENTRQQLTPLIRQLQEEADDAR